MKRLLVGTKFKYNKFSEEKLDGTLFGMILLQIKEFFPYYFLALFCLFFTHLIQSELPFIAKDVADSITLAKDYPNVWMLFLMAIGIIFFRTFSRLLFFFPARVMERDTRTYLMSRVEGAPPFRYKNFNPGQIFQCIFTDVEQIRAMVGFALLQIGNVVIGCLVLLPRIASFNSRLLVAFIPMAVSTILFTIIVGRTKKFQKRALDQQGEVQNMIMETYKGKDTIKNFHAESSFTQLFSKSSFKELVNFYYAGVGVSFSIPIVPLGVGISLLWGAYIIGAENLGASSLILFSGFTFLFLEPLAFISWIGIVYISSLASWMRIKDLVNALKEESEEEKTLVKENNQLNHQGLELSLNLMLWEKIISLNLTKGKSLVIAGATGDGKTELIKQISYLLKEKLGDVGYVSQNPYLYDDTFEKNLFLENQRTPALDEKAKELIKIFFLDEIEKNFNSLLKFPLGENGKRLSGGQVKRLCLVRSLLSDSKVLVWDDPFSSVDLILEKKIIDELKNLGYFEDKLIIMSSHRVSTVRLSDYYLLIDKNGIVEQGNTLLLSDKSSKIAQFFEKQSFEVEATEVYE